MNMLQFIIWLMKREFSFFSVKPEEKEKTLKLLQSQIKKEENHGL